MKQLIYTCLRRPVAVTMGLAALLLAGILALMGIPVDLLPEIQVPRVQISAQYTGLAARDIRTVLTIPLEDALASVRSLQRIRSVSRDGESLIVLDFVWGTKPEEAAILVREAIDGVYPQLPEGTPRPVVIPGDPETQPLAIVGVRSRTEKVQFARQVAEYELRARFRRIEDIGTVVLVGGQKEEIKIELDPQRSFTRGLGAAGFAELAGSEWSDVSAGTAREGNRELVIVSSGKPKSIDELAGRVLPSRTGPLYPADLGTVGLSYHDRESLFIADGREAVALELFRRPRSNPLSVAKAVRQTIAEAQQDLGQDVEVFLIYDGSELTRRNLMDLGRSALFGSLAVVLALFFFIRSGRGSLLTLLSLPISAAASLASLALAGKSLNSMSLGGLALGIGLVSDTSVIILELLERNCRFSTEKPQAGSVSELVASVVSSSLGSTLTTVIIFVPVLFLPGPLGALFADLSITLISAVTTGWLYAQFALPSLYLFFWRPSQVPISHIIGLPNLQSPGLQHQQQSLGPQARGQRSPGLQSREQQSPGSQNKEQDQKQGSPGLQIQQQQSLGPQARGQLSPGLQHQQQLSPGLQTREPRIPGLHRMLGKGYRRLLGFAFRKPFIMLGIVLVSVILGTLLLLSRPARFTPTEGAEELELELAFSPGTRLDTMVKHGEALSGLARSLPEIDAVFGRAGAEPEDLLHRASPDYRREILSYRCMLAKGTVATGAAERLRQAIQAYLDKEAPPDLAVKISFPQDRIEGLLGLSSAYTLALKDKTPENIQKRLPDVLKSLETRSPGAQFVSRPSGQRPEVTLRLKRDMAASAQISSMTVARVLQASTEGVVPGRIELEGRPTDIRLKARLDPGHPLEALEQLPVNEGSRAPVFLGSVASLDRTEGPAALARLDRSDVVYIDGTPASGNEKELGKVLQKAAKGTQGLSYSDESAFSRYRWTLLYTVLLVILLLYFVLAAQFESFTLPLLLMVSIPFSLSGAGPALVLVGAGLDSGSVIGLVVLFGLAVNNSIILYEVSKEKIDEGTPRLQAVYRGAVERLIPVLTTTSTTLLALLPIIVSPLGATQRSMSAAMFGGVAASTLITLIVIPPVLLRFLPGGNHAA
ncbi:MAG: efflux RND transporter permease subunit [Spirochaetota bacterium]